MKRLLDIIGSFFGLLATSPILFPVMFMVWWQDKHSPFYIAPRVGSNNRQFNMIKLRSMRVNADKSGVDSTSANDQRITKVGHFIRRYKLDELIQLWNVLKGDMSLVGPRPNVKKETDLYTPAERKLLDVQPGITDFSSIVFSDEGDVLKDYPDPDIAYNQLIRPGKSLLGLFYIDKRSFLVDVKLILLTILAIVSRDRALNAVQSLMKKLGAAPALIELAGRRNKLFPMPPPGRRTIVTSRESELEEETR